VPPKIQSFGTFRNKKDIVIVIKIEPIKFCHRIKKDNCCDTIAAAAAGPFI